MENSNKSNRALPFDDVAAYLYSGIFCILVVLTIGFGRTREVGGGSRRGPLVDFRIGCVA